MTIVASVPLVRLVACPARDAMTISAKGFRAFPVRLSGIAVMTTAESHFRQFAASNSCAPAALRPAEKPSHAPRDNSPRRAGCNENLGCLLSRKSAIFDRFGWIRERAIVRKQAWGFELYEEVRSSGVLQQMNPEEMRLLIEKTADRISRLALGDGEERKLRGSYEVLGGGQQWQLIREQGQYACTRLFAQGVRAFVAVQDLLPGHFAYTVGRMSPFVRFPLDRIFSALNHAEKTTDDQDRWGGSDTIGGSPRQRGSRLAPPEVEKIIEDVMSTE